MYWHFLESLVFQISLFITFVVLGGIWIDMASSGGRQRSKRAAQRAPSDQGALPSPEALEAFLAHMEPVRRALSRMTDQERDHWHRKAHVAIKEIQAIDNWLQAVSTWAPHQREAVEQSAQDKVQTRQRLIMDFARGVLQTAAPPASDTHKPTS